jgi:endonuclease-3
MKPQKVEEFFRRLEKLRPDPRSELDFINPYTLLVAVILSAQATDAGVNKATEPLFRVVDSPEKMLALGEDGLKRYIRTIGLFNTKARNVMAMSRILVEQHGGKVPRERAILETLPGVGRKTANVVLNVAFGEPTIAVDTHIFRVGNRTGLAPGKTPLHVELALEKIVPDRYRLHAHHWLILHGRYVCKARKPDCPVCPVVDLCEYDAKTPPGELIAAAKSGTLRERTAAPKPKAGGKEAKPKRLASKEAPMPGKKPKATPAARRPIKSGARGRLRRGRAR